MLTGERVAGARANLEADPGLHVGLDIDLVLVLEDLGEVVGQSPVKIPAAQRSIVGRAQYLGWVGGWVGRMAAAMSASQQRDDGGGRGRTRSLPFWKATTPTLM